jgi:hypothetical protein
MSVWLLEVFTDGRWSLCSQESSWDSRKQRNTKKKVREVLNFQRRIFPDTPYRIRLYVPTKP